MKNSKIEWTHHTFNPWIGCAKIDEMCTHCYAEVETFPRVQRAAGRELWGKGKQRHRTSEANWKQPARWNEQPWICDRCGEAFAATMHLGKFESCAKCFAETNTSKLSRARVFCASMSDWLDDEVPIEWLADLLKMIRGTPDLTWLLLTKRPENWMRRIEQALIVANGGDPTEEDWFAKHGDTFPVNDFADWLNEWMGGNAPHNVWMGTSVGTQKSADERIRQLFKIPAKVRFLSCEPLLEKIDIGLWLPWKAKREAMAVSSPVLKDAILRKADLPGIDWVICGGESGPKARPMHPDWARSLRDQCQAAAVPFFFKQWGEFFPFDANECQSDISPEAFISGDLKTGFNRVGKKTAGRLLDGREWNEFPKV